MAFEQLNDKYDVAISYRHETGFYMAQIVYTHLVGKGYTVFMDKTMDSGKYEEKIRLSIANCKNFVIILFPGDTQDLDDNDSWLNKESAWALENKEATIVPVMCDDFVWPKSEKEMTYTMNMVKKNNGIIIHKDYSIDSDLDNLCKNFLKNVNIAKPKSTTVEFFKHNLNKGEISKISGIDLAFHAGDPWLIPGERNDLLIKKKKKGIPLRVVINAVDTAENIGQHMRDKTALYIPFATVREQWKKLVELYPDNLEVRECEIPLIHVLHSIKFIDENTNNQHGEIHIKYYAYHNVRVDKTFQHEINSGSKYYKLYCDEFEFLWENSKKI